MSTVRSQLGRLTVVLAAVCAVAVAAPGTATAGGPTSVLLASPTTGSAAALYYADDDYALLSELLGGLDVPADSGEPAPASAAGSPYVTATWLIHDVSVWRIDRIFLIGGDVWVVSETSSGDGTLTGDGMYPNQTGNAAAVWHRPTDAAALTGLLSARGLLPATYYAGSRAAAPADLLAVPTVQAVPVPAAPGWWWGIGGLLIGLAAGGAVVRMVVRRRASADPGRSPAEPVQMLPMS